jgi:hypothetical protein
MSFHTINTNDKINSNKETIQYSSNIVSRSEDPVSKVKSQYWDIQSPKFTNFIGYIVNAFRKSGKPIYNIGGSPTPDNSKLSVFLYDIVNKILYPNDVPEEEVTEQQVLDVLDQDKQTILSSFVATIDTTDIDEVKQKLSDIDEVFLSINQKLQQLRDL